MFTSSDTLRKIIKSYLWLSHRSCTVSGNTSLPSGAKIIALNHTYGCDPFFLPLILDEQPYFLLQDGLFDIPVIGSLLKQSGQIPVYRDGERAKEAYEQACQYLREGKTIVVYPEGKLVPTGSRIQAKTGTIRMALETGAPIIPVGLYVPSSKSGQCQIQFSGMLSIWIMAGHRQILYAFRLVWNPSQ